MTDSKQAVACYLCIVGEHIMLLMNVSEAADPTAAATAGDRSVTAADSESLEASRAEPVERSNAEMNHIPDGEWGCYQIDKRIDHDAMPSVSRASAALKAPASSLPLVHDTKTCDVTPEQPGFTMLSDVPLVEAACGGGAAVVTNAVGNSSNPPLTGKKPLPALAQSDGVQRHGSTGHGIEHAGLLPACTTVLNDGHGVDPASTLQRAAPSACLPQVSNTVVHSAAAEATACKPANSFDSSAAVEDLQTPQLRSAPQTDAVQNKPTNCTAPSVSQVSGPADAKAVAADLIPPRLVKPLPGGTPAAMPVFYAVDDKLDDIDILESPMDLDLDCGKLGAAWHPCVSATQPASFNTWSGQQHASHRRAYAHQSAALACAGGQWSASAFASRQAPMSYNSTMHKPANSSWQAQPQHASVKPGQNRGEGPAVAADSRLAFENMQTPRLKDEEETLGMPDGVSPSPPTTSLLHKRRMCDLPYCCA
jgi:hypothetical protein